MEDLLNSILTSMSSINLPQKKFMAALLLTFAYFQGRANFRNLSRFCDLSEKRIARWSRRSFPYQEFNLAMLQKTQVIDHNWIASIDASFLPKSGRKTEGLGYFYSGCKGEVERGLEMSLLSVIDMIANTGFSLLARQTQVGRNGQAPAENRIEQAVSQIHACKEALASMGIQEIVADAWYSKETFIRGVMDAGFHILGKLRHDAHLKFLYTGKQTGKGRPRLYDGRVSITDFRRFKKIRLDGEDFNLYEKVVHSHSMKRSIKVVALRDFFGKVLALLYTTNLKATAESVLKKYRARFQIEFIIRDAKRHTGLTHSQARSSESIENHLNQSLSVLNLLKIEDQNFGTHRYQRVISIASWRRRKFNQHLATKLFSMLGFELDRGKKSSIIQEIGDYGAIAA